MILTCMIVMSFTGCHLQDSLCLSLWSVRPSVWPYLSIHDWLTHWGRVMHICGSKLAIIGSDNGLSPSRPQAIVWTKAGILLIWLLGTNSSEILFEIHAFSFKKMHLKMSSGKRRLFCLCLNELMDDKLDSHGHSVLFHNKCCFRSENFQPSWQYDNLIYIHIWPPYKQWTFL